MSETRRHWIDVHHTVSLVMLALAVMRRFLLHVLPDGFHRIRHYDFLAGAARVANVASIRRMIAEIACSLQAAENIDNQHGDAAETDADDEREIPFPCRCCGGRMTIIERFARGAASQAPFAAAWNDTS